MTAFGQLLDPLNKSELSDIVAILVEKFGNDAMEAVNSYIKHRQGGSIKAVEVDHQSSVSSSRNGSSNAIAKFKAEKKLKNTKNFDMTRYRQRHIAIQIQYEGESFYGFTSQTGGCEETVEKHIFEALVKLRLIDDKHSCQYSRCGRTDRGVSALGQTVALRLRSAIPLSVSDEKVPRQPNDTVCVQKVRSVKPAGHGKGEKGKKGSGEGGPKVDTNDPVKREVDDSVVEVGKKRKGVTGTDDSAAGEQKNTIDGDHVILAQTNTGDGVEEVDEVEEVEIEEIKEMDYCGMLNRVLPDTIRALGWCQVTDDFSSRFSCAYRKYRYFFVRRDLNIEAMSDAAALLVGEHDFRNVCKIDIAKVTNFRREVYSAQILPFQENTENPELSVWMLEIRGIAFLWHMVRCIMALLFMVGEGEEKPDCVTALLNIESMPAKPHYKMAPELPLVLHECGFDNMNIFMQPSVLWTLTTHFEDLWGKHCIAAARAKNALETIKRSSVRDCDVKSFVSYLTSKKKSIKDRKSGWKKDSKTLKGVDSRSNVSEADPFDVVDSWFYDSALCTENGEMLQWKNVLEHLSTRHGLSPTDPLLPHVPLTQRHTNDTYMDRRNHLTGNKKERLDRHLQLKESNSETDPNFFAKMRSQGSV